MRVAKANGHLRGKQPKLNPRQEAHLVELLHSGEYSTGEIGDLFGVARSTVYRAVARSKTAAASGRTTTATTATRAPAPRAVPQMVLRDAARASASAPAPEPCARTARRNRDAERQRPRDSHGRQRDGATDSEVAGLLALMLLIHARHRARIGSAGTLIPMADQDRSHWDTAEIAEGVALITSALPRGPTGVYQLQAAIAAIHGEAPSAEATDWPQIAALYDVLLRLDPNPVVALNHAVAVAMARGPEAGLELLALFESDTRVNDDRRFHAVRAHLLEMTGDRDGARASYEAAARAATNLQQQRYLHAQVARLGADAE